MDQAKKEISEDEEANPEPTHTGNKQQNLIVSQHKDVNPMETESSNESLMDMSTGPNHHFDISPL